MKTFSENSLISFFFKQAFQKVDAILAPVTPTTAFKLGEKATNPIDMYLSDIYTIAVNLAGLPALSMPGGFINNKPLGIQLIGNFFYRSLVAKIPNAQYHHHVHH